MPARPPLSTCAKVPAFLWTTVLAAQSCLVISTPSVTAGGTITMDLSLYSTPGNAPSAVQWTLSSTGLTNLSVDDGPALSAAGKAAFCAGDAVAYRCLIAGINTNRIANGVVARITATAAAGPVVVSRDLLAASPEGYVIPLVARTEPATGAHITPECPPQPPPKRSAAQP